MPKYFCDSKDLDKDKKKKKFCIMSKCSPKVRFMNPALTTTSEDRTTLMGITKAKRCDFDKDQEVSLYINVATYISWIRRNIGEDKCE